MASESQQTLLSHLKSNFVHESVLTNPYLAPLFNSHVFQNDEKLAPLTLNYFLKQVKVKLLLLLLFVIISNYY